jgi:hypothetical protein
MVAFLIPLWQLTGQLQLPRLKLLHLGGTHLVRVTFAVIEYLLFDPRHIAILSR